MVLRRYVDCDFCACRVDADLCRTIVIDNAMFRFCKKECEKDMRGLLKAAKEEKMLNG